MKLVSSLKRVCFAGALAFGLDAPAIGQTYSSNSAPSSIFYSAQAARENESEPPLPATKEDEAAARKRLDDANLALMDSFVAASGFAAQFKTSPPAGVKSRSQAEGDTHNTSNELQAIRIRQSLAAIPSETRQEMRLSHRALADAGIGAIAPVRLTSGGWMVRPARGSPRESTAAETQAINRYFAAIESAENALQAVVLSRLHLRLAPFQPSKTDGLIAPGEAVVLAFNFRNVVQLQGRISTAAFGEPVDLVAGERLFVIEGAACRFMLGDNVPPQCFRDTDGDGKLDTAFTDRAFAGASYYTFEPTDRLAALEAPVDTAAADAPPQWQHTRGFRYKGKSEPFMPGGVIIEPFLCIGLAAPICNWDPPTLLSLREHGTVEFPIADSKVEISFNADGALIWSLAGRR